MAVLPSAAWWYTVLQPIHNLFSVRFLLLITFYLLCFGPVQGQATLDGVVRDSLTQAPLPFASVFLANTSRGTTTDAGGRYQLAGIVPGQYELGVSYVGYKPYRQTLRLPAGPTRLDLAVAPTAQQLGEVVVRPNPNRAADFERFKELFLGTSTLARQCRLRNPDDVQVDYDPRQNALTASVTRPLEIDNPALGYRLTVYQLNFLVEFADEGASITSLSQVVFRELPGGAGQRRRWASNRLRAYRGSLPHFLRAVYADRLREESFEVRRLRRVINQRRAAVAARLRQETDMGIGGIVPDSVRKILEQPPVMTYLYRPLLPPDSLRRRSAEGRVWLRFRDLLAVTYRPEKPDPNYREQGPNLTSFRPETEESVLHLQVPEVEIQVFGTLLPALGTVSEGYWGFEKIGELLPLDYEPPAYRLK